MPKHDYTHSADEDIVTGKSYMIRAKLWLLVAESGFKAGTVMSNLHISLLL